HYEISNFARSGKCCRHNQGYWNREDCMALGAGGHSFKTREEGERWHNRNDLTYYRKALLNGDDPAELLENYDHLGAMQEYAYLTLRTNEGLSRKRFKLKFGLYPEEVFAEAIDKCGSYLQLERDRYKFNLDGWLIYDHLISNFL
ncbi:MAG: hypothetical protein KAU22_10905, partial [Desulfuromonadales bacterium]|nr:hypothetical protein [Desulfuromonadales bacterium]